MLSSVFQVSEWVLKHQSFLCCTRVICNNNSYTDSITSTLAIWKTKNLAYTFYSWISISMCPLNDLIDWLIDWLTSLDFTMDYTALLTICIHSDRLMLGTFWYHLQELTYNFLLGHIHVQIGTNHQIILNVIIYCIPFLLQVFNCEIYTVKNYNTMKMAFHYPFQNNMQASTLVST